MRISKLQARLGEFCLSIDYLVLEERKIHAFIGSNGCGKSTLAKIIMGVLPYEQGEMDFGSLQKQDIILASQKPYMLRDTVFENIIFPLKVRNINLNEEKQYVEEIDAYLHAFGIFDKKFEHARQLSSGQQQKVSLIRTLIAKPKFIIIDESLSNLDIESIAIAKDMLRSMHEEHHSTFVLISHQAASIADLVDIYHFFDKGEHLLSCSLDELKKSTHEKIRYYLKLQSFI